MILSKSWYLSLLLYVLLPVVMPEENGPSYDTSDWIPIVPDSAKVTHRESKSLDRILNIGLSGEKYVGEDKFPVKKTFINPHKLRKNPHMKRSPNQRPRIKLDQPYRFENILSPPPKQQVRGFQQKSPYQSTFGFQPQHQFNFAKPSHIVNQQTFQQFPVPSSPSLYNLNNLQAVPRIPSYTPTQLGVSYQQPNFVHSIPSRNKSAFEGSVHQGLFETTAVQSPSKNVKLPAQVPSEEKDSVQLLYVPLEQLQKQQSINSGILDEAFKSLQQQKLVAPPPEINLKEEDSQLIHYRPQQKETELLHYQPHSNEQNLNKQVYLTQQSQSSTNEERKLPQQYYILQNDPTQRTPEQPRQYELVSKNQGKLILQNNPKTVEVSSKQEYTVQAEKQQIVELTSQQPELNHQVYFNKPFEHQEKHSQQDKSREHQFQDSRVQGTRNYFKNEPQTGQSFTVQNQVSQPFSVEAPKLQQSYVVQNEPRAPIQQNYFQDSYREDQKARLQNIQKDILQQTLQVEKLQKQIQQGKSLDFQGKSNSQPPKKRKPHQPPLAVYMEGNQPGDVEAVLEVLKNAKSIAVQDQVGPNSPQVFIGPSNLNVPEGFAKFPLPYLSSLDNNRIQRKAQQFPFFVAPINYKEPEGYSKIPLPSPHVGSVVVSQFKQKQFPQFNNNFGENNRPVAITNYKFVNPSFESNLESNSHFDDSLNAYSLESGNPRDNPNRHIKEQTLLQQITGFSGFDYPQTQYFSGGRPTEFGQTPETISSTAIPPNDQYLKEVYQKTEETSPENSPRTVTSSSRQRTRGEKIRGNKKGSVIPNESNITERPGKTTTEQINPNPEIAIPEVPTPNIVRVPEKVEISSQNPLTQDFLNRFSSNNNFNFNYVSSTPGYAIPTRNTEEELPANIRKLKPIQNIPNSGNQQSFDAQFEQSIQNLQNSKETIPSNQEEQRVHVYNQYEQFELPAQLTEINPNLPGLINELEQQNQLTTTKHQTNPPLRTTQSTTQFTIRTTEATTTTSTTTRRPRGRGRGRFNMKTTTTSPYRRHPGERRRPSKATTPPTTEASYENSGNGQTQNERGRSRSRLQNSLTERLAEGSIESTSTSQQLLEPSTRVMDISQNQPNYFVQFQSSVDNVRPVLRDYVEEPKTETVRFVEQYQSQKVTPAEQLASQDRYQPPPRQLPATQSDRSESTDSTAIQKPAATEKPTRKRVRVRGRPKNKYSSTTIAPRTTSPPEKEENDFYGFFRQPNFSQSSQISNTNSNEEESIHIYAPTQQKTPVYNQRTNEPVGPADQPSDPGNPRFVGELRPKYVSPSRATTTQIPETTQKRIRGRVRVPGRSYESKTTTAEASSTEKIARGRVRGRTHFTPPRNVREESENEETENYPASFLKSREAATTPSEFKITVSMDEEKEDQIPHSSSNSPETQSREKVNSIGFTRGSENFKYDNSYEEPEDVPSRGEYRKKDGFRVVNLDQFDTAESQNYRSLFNALDSPDKVNDLKSQEIDEKSTETTNTSTTSEPEISTEAQNKTGEFENDLATTTEVPENQNTSIDDLNSTILKSVQDTISNSTTPFHLTTTTESSMESDAENSSREIHNTSAEISAEDTTLTTSTPEGIFESYNSEEVKIAEQTPMDLLNLQTSTSTEVSHETEICYKGRCVKSRNKKLRRRLLRKKVNETNV